MSARSCAAAALCLAALVPFSPPLIRRAFWKAHRPPAGQAIHVPKFPPDFEDNSVRGIPTNSFITDRRMDFLEHNFTHVPGDIWIVTYQKVGTTWTQYITTLLLGHPRLGSTLDLFAQSPWPEVDVGIIAHSPSALQKSATTATTPRVFKSHWPRRGFYSTLPETSKVIYVFRDAESVAVSYWNHIHNLFGFYWLKDGDMTWDEYFEKWISGDMQSGCYFKHVASWWEVSSKENTLFLRYEELRADTPSTVRRIAEFIGSPATPLSDERLAEILDATSKGNMRKWNEGLADKFLIMVGVMKGDHIRKDGAKQKVRATGAQRARMMERFEAELQPMGVPKSFLFSRGA